MIKKIFQIVTGTLLVASIVLGVSFLTLHEADASPNCTAAGTNVSKCSACFGSGGTWDNDAGKCTSADGRTVPGTLQQVANILIFLIGAVSVVMIIIGAMRYTLAQGDQAAVGTAKNTILYAVIGLVLSMAAYGIVNFVTSQF
ncbi:MAG TPA: pilin [Candidatus Saccharimonadales bacterium]|nr:pilin [Candidatus Saccharimonadales bacterium]